MWKEYEREVYQALKKAYPECEIEFDDSILGIYSKAERQIDFSIRGTVAGKRILGIVDCKFYNKNIDVKGVESFIGMSQDVNANFGFIITNNGYSQAAKNRIKYSSVKLDILEFNEFGKIDIPVDYFFNQNIKGLQLSKYEFVRRNKQNTGFFDPEKSDYFKRIICYKEKYVETEYYAFKKLLENSIRTLRDFEKIDEINIFIPVCNENNKHLYSCKISRNT
ncbi:restriction endonuclease, partial [Chryseobacterium sp. SN22]|uniref:restriction endonuclease n=1 Tax=Chryseobacterium sp. SN22 TaxID=2606431 RepID=UPI0011F0032D